LSKEKQWRTEQTTAVMITVRMLPTVLLSYATEATISAYPFVQYLKLMLGEMLSNS
jgi:hypothetical protein